MVLNRTKMPSAIFHLLLASLAETSFLGGTLSEQIVDSILACA